MPKDRTVNDPIYSYNELAAELVRGYTRETEGKRFSRLAREQSLDALYNLDEQYTAEVARQYGLSPNAMIQRGQLKKLYEKVAPAPRSMETQKAIVYEQKILGTAKASAARAAERVAESKLLRNVPGIRSGAYSYGAMASAGNQLIQQNVDLYYQLKRIRERRRDILSVGRRGAAATRVLQPSAAGRTNRTGAASTRRLQRPAAPGVQPVQSAPAKSAGNQAGAVRAVSRSSGGLASPSDTRARAIMKSSPAMPTATKSGASTWNKVLSKQLQDALSRTVSTALSGQRSIFTTRRGSASRESLSRGFSPSSGTTSSASTKDTVRTNPLLAQMSNQQQAQSEKCRCKKSEPKKSTKERKARCSNPLVSRTEKDGYIITKRKISCPPSKQNFPSLPA